jgi:sulfate/thiosulfate transport system substrate-binding protein
MSFGGSGKQARTVMDGLPADIASLALGYDVEAIGKRLGQTYAQQKPFYSTIVFLVRTGNPKEIHDWDDLARSDIRVVTPNPKSSGAARWGYLAAWGYAERRYGKNSAAAKDYMRGWLSRVPVFDTGARAATTNFVRRGQGDVLITWENEAHLARHAFGEDRFELVQPSLTIRAEPVVAVLRDSPAAQAYVSGLWQPPFQRLAATHYFRPARGAASSLPPLPATLLRIEDFGGWDAAHQMHFAQGALFDQLLRGKR